MNGTKHTSTPGPWKVRHNSDWIETEGDPYGHGPMHVADARGWGHLTGTGACNLSEREATAIQDANARLIAAAPYLLEACHAFVHWYSEDSSEFNRDTAWEKAKAAIAKATGEVL